MKRSGFSLLQVLIYVSLLAMISLLVIGSILSVYRALLKTKIEKKIITNGDIAIETMARSIRDASSVDVAGSTFGANPGVLKLNSRKFYLSTSTLEVQDGIKPAQDLTSSDAKVTSLVFYRDFSSASSTLSDIIKIEITVESGDGQFLKSKKFYNSAVLRGEY